MTIAPYSPPLTTDAALRVLEERYLQKVKQPDGTVTITETPQGLYKRVAYAVAEGEREFVKIDQERAGSEWGSVPGLTPREEFTTYLDACGHQEDAAIARVGDQFDDLLLSGDFLPNSPCLMNAGKGNGLQLSACFVLPIEDSIEGIFNTIRDAATVHQSGGGTGFSFSRLRPAGATVKRSMGVASGPVSFLKIFDVATEQIKQGGTRRGANMAVLRCDHTDVETFIHCKEPIGVLAKLNGTNEVQYPITNFNCSIGITDVFMDAVREDGEYDLIDPDTKAVTSRRRARDIWDQIVDCAWRTGDPGLIFLDRVNASRANPIPEIESIEATNPCGEQPLGPYDVCNLGSINLGRFVIESVTHYFGGYGLGIPIFDWARFRSVVRLATRFLDDVIEINPFPLPQITKRAQDLRRIGLGVMGFADLLFLLGIAYHTPEARALGNDIMRVLNEEAISASENLAVDRGAFPLQNVSRYKNDAPRRNSNLTTVAPTGSISILGNCSSGIEPVFALFAYHSVKQTDGSWRNLKIANAAFRAVAEHEGFWSGDLEAHVVATGSVQGVAMVPERWQRVFRTAGDISLTDHILMQAAWQEHNDSGISKTGNAPNSTTREEIGAAYILSYTSGCMGTTIYRDGCKEVQVYNIGKTADDRLLARGGAPQALLEASTEMTGDDDVCCPNCGIDAMADDGGCVTCQSCGYSQCDWTPVFVVA